METEIWKDVQGYDGLYQVSSLGRIRSLGRKCKAKNNSTQSKRPRILTQEITVFGYCRVRLFNSEGMAKHYAVHRLVMEAFSGPSDCQVNHINEIKTDNRLVNLEYCSAMQNCNYGTRNKRLRDNLKGNNSKPVNQYDTCGRYIATYSSRLEAEAATGISASKIGACCTGNRKAAGGYMWRDAKCQAQ